MAAQRSDVTVLLRTEHAVARVLASAPGEQEAYPELLAAMGESLAWDFGAVWVPRGRGAALRWTTWPEAGDFAAESRALELGPGEGLPGPRVGGRGAGLAHRRADRGRLPARAAPPPAPACARPSRSRCAARR